MLYAKFRDVLFSLKCLFENVWQKNVLSLNKSFGCLQVNENRNVNNVFYAKTRDSPHNYAKVR